MEKKELTREHYVLGVLDICDFLYSEMTYFLQEEDRYYGTVKSYANNLRDCFRSISKDPAGWENIDSLGRVLYVLRPQIYKDFSRLGQKKLSGADRIICIMRKLLELSAEVCRESNIPQPYPKETKTIQKVLGKLWDNIRNKAKSDSLYSLSDLFRTASGTGRWGKYSYDILDLISLEHPKPKKLDLRSPKAIELKESAQVSQGERHEDDLETLGFIKKKEIIL